MKINFAQVPHTDIDTFGDDNLFGPDQAGNFYYNYVEYGTNPGGTDEVAIHDGCERYMPLAIETIPELIAALEEILRISAEIKFAKEVTTYVESDAEANVDNYQVKHNPESVQEAIKRAEYY
jgi:hypothetical protein